MADGTLRKVSLLDAAWREQKSSGMTITRPIKYSEILEDGSEILTEVEVPIRILAGTDNAQLQEEFLVMDEHGNPETDSEGAPLLKDNIAEIGEVATVALSTGLSMEDTAALKRDKGLSFWRRLVLECNKYNGVTQAEIESEKNADAPVPSAG